MYVTAAIIRDTLRRPDSSQNGRLRNPDHLPLCWWNCIEARRPQGHWTLAVRRGGPRPSNCSGCPNYGGANHLCIAYCSEQVHVLGLCWCWCGDIFMCFGHCGLTQALEMHGLAWLFEAGQSVTQWWSGNQQDSVNTHCSVAADRVVISLEQAQCLPQPQLSRKMFTLTISRRY